MGNPVLLACSSLNLVPEAEFKEFDPRLKFKPRLTYGWFHLKLYEIFQDLSWRSTVFGGFETRLKFIKFGHMTAKMNQFNPKDGTRYLLNPGNYNLKFWNSFYFYIDGNPPSLFSI